MGVLGDFTTPWADSGVKTPPTTALNASGWTAGVPPGASLMNWLFNWVSAPLKTLDTALTDSEITINITAIGGQMQVVNGTADFDYGNGHVRSSSTSPLHLIVDLSSLLPRNADGSCTWQLDSVRALQQVTGSGAFGVAVRTRDITALSGPGTVTALTFPAGNDSTATATATTTLHADADTDHDLLISMVPDSAANEVTLHALQLKLTRSGVP